MSGIPADSLKIEGPKPRVPTKPVFGSFEREHYFELCRFRLGFFNEAPKFLQTKTVPPDRKT